MPFNFSIFLINYVTNYCLSTQVTTEERIECAVKKMNVPRLPLK